MVGVMTVLMLVASAAILAGVAMIAWTVLYALPVPAESHHTRSDGLSKAQREQPAVPLPRHRSPYGSGEALDGEAHRLVRPYLAEWERRSRRRVLLCATRGIDLDQHLVGTGGAR